VEWLAGNGHIAKESLKAKTDWVRQDAKAMDTIDHIA
jgi:hypothetical protein